MKKIILSIIAIFAAVSAIKAQEETTRGLEWSNRNKLEYEVCAGFNIGGTSPLPIPGEIRKILSFNPDLQLSLGANITKWINPKWGVRVGLQFQSKGMETKAKVKNYGMEIIQDGSRVKGNWTGNVKTKYKSSLFYLPISAAYKINNRWKVFFGPYVDFVLKDEFSGYVYNGYLREGDPTGNKVTFDGETKAEYNFSDELRWFHYGIQGGGSWQAFKHLAINAQLQWGLNNIFKSSFKTISFALYPIYLNLGFSYTF